MRRLRMAGAVAALALLAEGCGSEVGRYQKFGEEGACRLDTLSGEVVCVHPDRTRVLIPAGPYSVSN